MFGKGSGFSGNSADETSADFLRRADALMQSGDEEQAVHLYLAAFENDVEGGNDPSSQVVDGLRRAFSAAVSLKERSLAEYVFGKFEPYATQDETAKFTQMLHQLVIDKLESFGLSKEALSYAADLLSEGGLDVETMMDFNADSLINRIRSVDTNSRSGSEGFKILGVSPEGSRKKKEGPSKDGDSPADERVRFSDLIGYDRAIERMNDRGIGMNEDQRFKDFMNMLSLRHGIDGLPASDTLVFRSLDREDASRFMAATAGEFEVPIIRMAVEESMQGSALLYVMSTPDFKFRPSYPKSAFDEPVVLLLESIDLWGEPMAGMYDEADGMAVAQITRGAREAIGFIRLAVENPKVHVMATCAQDSEVPAFFTTLLDPIEYIDIDLPDAQERADIWKHIAQLYPSMRFLNREPLVDYSQGMSRADIYHVSLEAVNKAYKDSIAKRSYVPVTRENIFDALAAFQPLDSEIYQSLEDEAVSLFRNTVDHLDDLLEGSAE